MNKIKIIGVSLFMAILVIFTFADRYIDNGDGTVSDTVTGLMWIKDPSIIKNSLGRMNQQVAKTFCANLVTNGYSDWRLPSLNEQNGISGTVDNAELDTLFRLNGNPTNNWEGFEGTPFTNIPTDYAFWSSTIYNEDTNKAWAVNMNTGNTLTGTWSIELNVWPVRTYLFPPYLVPRYFIWQTPQ